jgi:hypothetical protein
MTLRCGRLPRPPGGREFLNHVDDIASSPYTFAAKAHIVPIGYNPCRGIEKFPEDGRERYL